MHKHILPHSAIGLFLLFLISCSVSELGETAATKAPSSPEPWDCTACHEGEEVLTEDHVDTRSMTGSECSTCHEAGSNSLYNRIPLSHMHQLAGISCKECHDDPASVTPADLSVCRNCHNDINALYDATSEVGLNPHFSPHEGKIPDCNRCHHQHKDSENFCTQCHGQ